MENKTLTAVIIDDLEQARQTLRRDLEIYAPHVKIIGEASGVIDGARLLKGITPDIVFLDVQMQDGSGFDLLDVLHTVPFRIIFITAYDAHAIKAFRYAAVDYLMKPVDPDELKVAIEKATIKTENEQSKYNLLNESLKTGNKRHSRLALNTLDKIFIVNIDEILRCESNANYTEFFFTGGKKLLVTKTLKEFEDLLTPLGFFRIHQSHLVNTKLIREFVKTDGGTVIMNDGSSIPVSTRRRAEVVKMLEGL